MNLKALLEKRNDLLNTATELVDLAKTEVRSLTEDQKAQFDTLTDEIRSIDLEISNLQSHRKDGKKIEKNMEVQDMDKEKEVRGLEQFLRNQDGEEARALVKTESAGAVIPESVEGTIVLKMEETSPVFARAKKIGSVAGSLKIAKETENTVAGFVGEGAEVLEGKIGLDEVKLTQKRVGAAISLSNQLVNDSAVNIVDYAISLLARRAGKAVEKSILGGQKGDEFSGITTDVEVKDIKTAGVVNIDTLMDLYNSVHPEFLDGSSFILSRPFFNQVAKLKDNNGHFYMQNGVINGKLTYTLLGAEVLVTDSLTAEIPALFGNIEQAYAVMIKKGFSLQHVAGDTTQALRGSQLLVLDGYMDGAIYNPQAIGKLTITEAEE